MSITSLSGRRRFSLPVDPRDDVYTPREIARAAGVADADAVVALGGSDVFVAYDDAVHLARTLARRAAIDWSAAPLHGSGNPPELFALVASGSRGATPRVPLLLSSTLHAGALAAVAFITALSVSPAATGTARQTETARLVYLAEPGPGGGGGGGGRRESRPVPRAQRAGVRSESSPVTIRETVAPEPRPEPPLAAESLPAVVAPVVSLPNDNRDRAGVLDSARNGEDSSGAGTGGGGGAGAGTGVGEGTGPGIGPGSGGGTGGGPYRPGSGIQAPRLLREVKANYTDAARRRGVEGDVVLEIVVRRDGTVGDVRVLEPLEPELDARAVEAVRQWRFAPATRNGTPVDVLVEVAVEFQMR